jgi:hypothetical protein
MKKIYHIVHIDRLASIISSGFIFSDAKIRTLNFGGTTIGMNKIKQRRLNKTLSSYTDLKVGECVPFYFCPRSIMLYILYKRNHPDVDYEGGQENIIHLEADLYKTIDWANANKRRWVFTDANAGSYYFNDYNNISDLNKLNWNAIYSNDWKESHIRESKQSEFLCEDSFDFGLVERVGVINDNIYQQVQNILVNSAYNPKIEIKRDWYY